MSKINSNRNRSPGEDLPKGRNAIGHDSLAVTTTCRMIDESSLREVSVIESMTTFLQEHGGGDIDPKVLRTIAEALSKRLSDTSPGTLKDVTMEHSYGIGFPCSSLQQSHGTTSPSVQGRSVREFEEQMASLRKENFNLKLRLYFLEESVPGYQQSNTEGQETLMKQLIDTKVEMEILRKELEEKQEILKEAAQAMNQMEQIQKETESKSQIVIDELKQKIQYLEMERDLDKPHHGDFMSELMGRSEISENVNALQKVRELEAIMKHSEERMIDLQIQKSNFEDLLVKRDETIKEYEEKVKELAFQNAELLETIENKERELGNAERLHKELSEKKLELADKACMLDDAEQELKIRTQAFDKACRTIHKLMQLVKSHEEKIANLQKNQSSTPQESNVPSDNQQNKNGASGATVSSLECTGLCRSLSDSEAFVDLSGSMKRKYDALIEKHEKTIAGLRSEVKKKTSALQNLVNKELWEKNREIERLTKLINKSSTSQSLSPSSALKTNDLHELQQSFTETEYTKALEHNQLLQRKVDVLNQRLIAEHNNEALIAELQRDVRNARAEAESADKWRRECANVCSLLSNRLEELAGFLNSLLKHKDVIGLMAPDRRRAMRSAIDSSLDLSKSLNMTLSISMLSTGDQSLSLLHNESRQRVGVEEDGLERESLGVIDQIQSRYSFDTLRAENRALKKELDRINGTEPGRKDRRSLPILTLENHSESEAWSEPDRQVSLARIGLEERSTTSTKDQQNHFKQDATDSESENDALQQSSRTSKLRSQDRVTHLEKMIAQRDERILILQCQLVETDNNLKKESLRAIGLTQEVDHLRMRNEELYTDMIAIGTKETKCNISEVSGDNLLNKTLLTQQIEEKTQVIEKLQEDRDRIAVEARLAEVQIGALKADIEEIKNKYEKQLNVVTEKEQQKLTNLKCELEALMQERLTEKEQLHQEMLARDWVARTMYEECKVQLVQLQAQYIDAQRNIDYLTESEQELKQSLLDSELAARALKKQLDESTLQASKVILERTKVCNDKLQLENRVQDLQQQLNAVELERKTLQQRVAQLEKMQQQQLGKRLIANDASHSGSGYTSEDVPQQATTKKSILTTSSNAKRENNSSPDLGIESDTGRVSSVELSHAQRSLLKIVELPDISASKLNPKHDTSYNNVENDMSVANVKQDLAATASDNGNGNSVMPVHDCVKVEQENAELRLKLTRTKRSLEDTYMRLRVANQRKAHFEKEIKSQIIKTQNVLRSVRSNMED